MTFDAFGFDSRLAKGIAASRYIEPTPIQRAAIPEILAGRDVVGVAHTGTGKTAAFMLPSMQRLLGGKVGSPRVLVLAPTRELAEQTARVGQDLGRHSGLKTLAVYGGVNKRPQAERIARGVDILVACPGRLLDLYDDGDLDFSRVEVLVLDEADRLFDLGFWPDVRAILALLPDRRQNLFFSATMPRSVRSLVDGVLHEPVTIAIGESAPAPTVSQVLYPVPEMLKGSLLAALLDQARHARTLVFARTKHRARGLANALARQGHRVAALEGNMAQSKRQAAVDGFRDGVYDVLVATDVAARGIDVKGIARVVNYDMPDSFDAYTHRVGRTGRAHATGEAVNLVSVMDTPLVREIQQNLGAPLEQRAVAGFDYGDYRPHLYILPPRTQSATPHGLGRRRPLFS